MISRNIVCIAPLGKEAAKINTVILFISHTYDGLHIKRQIKLCTLGQNGL